MDENLNTLDELVRTSREYRDILADIENFKYGERIAEFIERMDGSIKEIKDIIYDVRQEVLSFYKAQKEGNVKGTKESKDSNYFFHSYQEYYEGLIDYIKKINEAILKSNGVDNEEKINIIKKLDAVIEKDNQFKDSIEMKECDLSELILNIETAIDVIPFLEKCKNNISTITKIRTLDEDIRVMFARLYTNSVTNFACEIEQQIRDSIYKAKTLVTPPTPEEGKDVVCFTKEDELKIW